MGRTLATTINPLQQFTLILLLLVVIGCLSFSLAAAWLIQRTVLGQVWLETHRGLEGHLTAVFGSDIYLQPVATDAHAGHATGPSDAYAPESATPVKPVDLVRFGQIVRGHLFVYDIVHARFYRADGQIVYSYKTSEIGQPITSVLPARVIQEASDDDAPFELGHLGAEHSPTGQAYTDVAITAIPVLRDGRRIGGAVFHRDISALMRGIRRAQAILVGVNVVLTGILYFGLRRVFATSTQTIRRQSLALATTNTELRTTYDATLKALVAALDSRDTETGGHAQRVTRVALLIGLELGLGPATLGELERAALLHDVGKIGVPDAILRKSGPLDPAEWRQMQLHTEYGAAILTSVSFLSSIAPLVRHHHERWDGYGYPDQLKGEQIPLGARIFAVADAFDAMTSHRPYRAPFSLRQARQEIRRAAGSQFDPSVVAAFERLSDRELMTLMEVIVLDTPHRDWRALA